VVVFKILGMSPYCKCETGKRYTSKVEALRRSILNKLYVEGEINFIQKPHDFRGQLILASLKL